MKKILLHLTTALALVVAVSIQINAQPTLDNTFSGDGVLLKTVSASGDDIGRSVLIQNNGRILTGGNSFNMIGYSDIHIIRTKTNGNMDNTFGTGGVATISGGFFCDMALLPNGKIIVAGSGVGPTNVNNFIVYRLTKNGALDNTFGTGGSVEVNMPNKNMICFDVIIQADNKILLAGYADDGYGGHHNMIIVRLKANGSLDNTFATAGKFTFIQSIKSSECNQLALQPDGKIVAGGFIDTLMFYAFYRYDFAALRLNTNGTLDNTFGIGGVVRANKGETDIASSVSILSDGRIVLGGSTDYLGNDRFAALCLMPDGTYDMSFGTGGWTYLDFYGGNAGCSAMVAEPDDDLILAGLAYIYAGASYQTIALAKLLSDGTPDNTFGDNGIDTSFFGITTLGCNDIALQTDNKIVIAGYHYEGSQSSYLLARYTNSATFMKQPIAETDQITNFTLYPNPAVDQFLIQCTLPENTTFALVAIYDVNGNMIYQNQLPKTDGNISEIISTEHFPSGIYFVKMIADKFIHTERIVISK